MCGCRDWFEQWEMRVQSERQEIITNTAAFCKDSSPNEKQCLQTIEGLF